MGYQQSLRPNLMLKQSHGMDMADIMDTGTHTDTDTMGTILESDLLMPSQKPKLKLSHGMDIVDIMDTVTHTDMDTMVTILERDLPMLNQKQHQKLKLMLSHGTDIEDTEATTEAIEATDIVATTGDRFLF